jgi:hypothetical protein
MNIRWPLWLPATNKDVTFFVIQVASIICLLLGHFNDLPVLPRFDQLPNDPGNVTLWCTVISCLNYLIINKNARNDYISIHESIMPTLITWAIFSAIFFVVYYLWGAPVDWSHSKTIIKWKAFVYAQICLFVTLNISFLFKDNNSPIREISKELLSIRRIWRRRSTIPSSSQQERQGAFVNLEVVLQALRATLIKNAALFGRHNRKMSAAEMTERVEEASRHLRTLGPENSFKDLVNDKSELATIFKELAKYTP